MGHPVEINALFFALKGGSVGTEIVFLNQNLAIHPTSIVRDFHADLLRRVPHCLFDFVTHGPTAEGKPMESYSMQASPYRT